MKKNYAKLLLVVAILMSGISFAQNKQKKFIKFDKSNNYSLQNAKQLIKENLQLSSDDELVKTKTDRDELGFTHEKYQQFIQGVKVEFSTYTVHAKNGVITSMNGELFSAGKLNTSPSISKQTAFNKAITHVGAQKYMWENSREAAFMNYSKPQGELVILPVIKGVTKKSALAYKFDVYATQPVSRAYIYIDAHTGKFLFKNNIIKHAVANATAATRYSGTKTIKTDSFGGSYRLRDYSRGSGIETYNMQTGTSYGSAVEFTDNDNNWTAAEYNNAAKDNAALDAHYGAQMTYDYWMTKHNRNSYDGNGAKIKSYVHYSNAYDNAYWNGSVMTYGDGSGTYFDALTSLDVAAHEIGHAVMSNTANLTYSYESGAMNEGFSDIWGASVEYFADPNKQTWLIGEDIERRAGHAALRSMSNPKSEGQPDTYQGTNWATGSADNGGVHTNSGVLNYWYYLISVGGSGTNDNGDSYTVTGITIDKAAKIAYRLESVYLSASSQYADARTGAIQAAVDLYGSGSQEEISVTNAWHAVGIGAAYVQTCALGAPANFASSSINNNGFTLTWSAVSGAASYTVSVGSSTTTVNGTSYTATGLTSGTAYACSVAANCTSGGSGSTATTNVTTTGSAPLNYCTSKGNTVTDEYIQKVQLGTINNTSGSGGGYSDHTAISTNLTKGAAATITITPKWTGTVYSEGYSVWIDYNHDGDFADAGEQVWSKAASKTTPVSGTFTVPTGATTGNTRMRVSMKYNGIPTACETFSYGEVEDYTVNLVAGVADTTAPVITLTGAATINLNVGDTYTEQGATATDNVDGNITSSIVIGGDTVNTAVAGTYVVTYNVSDAAGNAATQVTRTVNVTAVADTTAPVITLTGAATINLNVGDTYTEQGATATDNVDGNITSSIVIGGDTVNTAVAGTYVVTYNVSDAAGNAATQVTRTVNVNTVSSGGCTGGIASYPYNESFENTLGAWSQASGDDFNWTVKSGSTPSSNTGPTSANDGTYYIYMESSSPNYSTKRAILNSPCFDLSGETQATVSFMYHMYGASTMGSLALEASTDNGTTWTSVWSKSGNQGNSWLAASVNLASYVGATVKLRFNGVTGTTWQGDMAVDKFSISGGGTTGGCVATTLTITFDDYPAETSWDIKDNGGTVVASGGTYGSQAKRSTLTVPNCLPAGCYTFTMKDSYGDGMCCSYGNGSFSLKQDSNGSVLASGGSFTSSSATNFCVTAAITAFTNNNASNNQTLAEEVTLYPNPATNNITIGLRDKKMNQYTISNMMGQVVSKGKVAEKNINIANLKEGVYFIEFSSNKKRIVKRFIKK